MALLKEIPVPLLAVNDTTLTVVEISFANGAKVKKGDNIMVFETSKTTYDVAAPEDGFIQYLCEAGHDYEVNEVVARIFSEEAEARAVPVAGPASSTRSATDHTAATGNAAPGNASTGNASMGKASMGNASMGNALPLNGHANVCFSSPESVTADAAALTFWEGETLFSKEADRLITAAGLDKAAFRGKDFVSATDVQHLLQPSLPGSPSSAVGAASLPVGAASSAVTTKAPKPSPAPAVDPAQAILQRLSSGKKREIEYLSEVQSTGLTSTINTFVDVEGIFTHINPALKYLKDSLLPVIVYESARLLADYPLLNAWFNGDGVALYREVNPGFAIDIDKGLKVLKITRAGGKSIGEIEGDILRLSGSYLDDTLQLEELTDITFTITDLSAEGVAFFRPLINKLNSSILGLSAIDSKMQRFTLSLSFDHRVTEGRLAARFLKELKERLESYRPTDFAHQKDIACFKCYKTLKEDLGGAGFVRCVTPQGKDGYICQACLKGF